MLSSPFLFDPFAIKNWTRETEGKTRLAYGHLGERCSFVYSTSSTKVCISREIQSLVPN